MSVPPDEHRDPGVGDPLADFDPYRFGAPEHPVPAEFAPPGYQRPTLPSEPDRPKAPPPPAYFASRSPAYPPPRAGNGKAIASMVLGIGSIVLCWLTIFDAVPVVLALVLGIVALAEVRSNPARGGRGMAITGIVCAAVGAVLAIVLTTWFVHLANQCGGFNTDSATLQQCVRDHI